MQIWLPDLGGFHIAVNFMGAIGYFMKESRMEYILVESKICSWSTANKEMSENNYYQMLRCHTLVSEAIREKWLAFKNGSLLKALQYVFQSFQTRLTTIFFKTS